MNLDTECHPSSETETLSPCVTEMVTHRRASSLIFS